MVLVLHHMGIWSRGITPLDLKPLLALWPTVTVLIHPDELHLLYRINGRGISGLTISWRKKVYHAAEVIMTVLHVAGKFEYNSYKVSWWPSRCWVSCCKRTYLEAGLPFYHSQKMAKLYGTNFSAWCATSTIAVVGDSDGGRHHRSFSKPSP